MADYKIKILKRARRDLKKLDPDAKDQIEKVIEALADNPRPQSSKLMKGNYKGYRRERTCNYRIIYEVRDKELLVLVVRAGYRKNIY